LLQFGALNALHALVVGVWHLRLHVSGPLVVGHAALCFLHEVVTQQLGRKSVSELMLVLEFDALDVAGRLVGGNLVGILGRAHQVFDDGRGIVKVALKVEAPVRVHNYVLVQL